MTVSNPTSESQAPILETAPSPTTPVPTADIIDKIILRQSVNLLAGAPGTGKTALIAWMLTRFRDHATIFGYTPAVIPKLAFVCADRSWDNSTRFWFEAAGYGNIPHYSLQDDLAFAPIKLRNKASRITILQECLLKIDPLPAGSLVVVDPLALFLGGNLLDYDSCLVACTQIRRICRERNITIIGTAHAAKQKNDKKERYLRLQDRILGSTALYGYTDTQMYLASPEETGEKYYTFLWHSHHRPAEIFPLGRDSAGLFVPYDESPKALEESKVLKAIPDSDEGITFAELLATTELGKSTVFRNLQDLIGAGLVEKIGHGRYKRCKLN